MVTISNETVYAFLERRVRELSSRAAGLRGELQTVEAELAHVLSAQKQIGNLGADDKARFGAPQTAYNDLEKIVEKAEENRRLMTAYTEEQTTIKNLILKALDTAFQQTGATPANLREFIKNAYGREISPTSMSPQLTRLKTDELVKQKEDDRWFLTRFGRAALAAALKQ